MAGKIIIKHERDDGKEFGYGIYINAYDTEIGGLASICVPFNASPEQIKRAELNVRQRAYRQRRIELHDSN